MGFPFTSIDIRDLINVHFQVVYVTATFPYLVLIIFFFRGITLHGFERGLEHLFVPEVKIKSTTNKWVECRIAVYVKLIWGVIVCFRETLLLLHVMYWFDIKTSLKRHFDIDIWSELEFLNIELDEHHHKRIIRIGKIHVYLDLEFVLFLSSVEQVVWAGGMAGRRHTDFLLLWPGFRLLDCTVIL